MKVIDRNAVVMRARELRRSPTLPEGLLWQALRKRPQGLKFRRQHPLGPFIVDFFCPAVRMVVEVDGESHSMGDRPSQDARRDGRLREQGLRVVRFNASDVMNDVEAVVTGILLASRS